jgi:amino acid transporter
MTFNWILLAHIASTFLFLAMHGVSMVVLYRIRGERDRERIMTLVTLSGATTLPMYIALLLIAISGVLAALQLDSFTHWWVWVAIAILVATIGLMTAVAKPYFAKVKLACQVRPTGVPRTSDEELAEILGGPTAHVITAIGVIGLVAILYLMIFTPGVI